MFTSHTSDSEGKCWAYLAMVHVEEHEFPNDY